MRPRPRALRRRRANAIAGRLGYCEGKTLRHSPRPVVMLHHRSAIGAGTLAEKRVVRFLNEALPHALVTTASLH